jgi:hypothetical protein
MVANGNATNADGRPVLGHMSPPADLARVGNSIEDQVRFKHFAPPPDTYNPRLPESSVGKLNNKISDAKIKTYLDVALTDNPGPGKYDTAKSTLNPGGGKLYLANQEKVRGKTDELLREGSNSMIQSSNITHGYVFAVLYTLIYKQDRRT